jgi:predicted metal-dependent phosphoesterase TrpH
MIDLHTHTTFSDGTLSPTELVTLAAARGLSAVAVTDHDTIDGLPEALAAGERLGIRVVRGVEINLEHDGATMDMLGYFLRGEPGVALGRRLVRLRESRDERNARILASLAELGMPLEPAELEAAAGECSVGRPHIGLALVRRGYVASVAEAFRLYLRRGAPAWVDRRRLSLPAAVELIREAGGVAVLAHPGLIHAEHGLETTVREAAAAGIAGLECHHPGHNDETITACLRLAERFGLVVTGGSDFHGAIRPDADLGHGPGGMTFSEEFLVRLSARAETEYVIRQPPA